MNGEEISKKGLKKGLNQLSESDLEKLKKEAEKGLKKAENFQELKRQFKRYLGKEGLLSLILGEIGSFKEKERKRVGAGVNEIKKSLERIFEEKRAHFQKTKKNEEEIDVTIRGGLPQKGHLHPLTQTKREIMNIFQKMGFEVAQGPEVETQWYNFDALEIPENHPARDMWDTFWLKEAKEGKPLLLRTHTSPVQIRYMEENKPPLKIIAPGRLFRHEATDASHEFQLFHLEGLMVDRSVSAANFKAVVSEFFKHFFKRKCKIRLRPSYFPFTEPSFEIDIGCVVCEGTGCSTCSETGWLELMGAGMVHPKVLENLEIDSEKYQGFAFGLGIDRLAMMKWKIPEVRWFHSGDLRFLEQF